jgi:hypothetical protein
VGEEPSHVFCAHGSGCSTHRLDHSAEERPCLVALKSLEEGTNEGEKGRTNTVLSCVDDLSKFLS